MAGMETIVQRATYTLSHQDKHAYINKYTYYIKKKKKMVLPEDFQLPCQVQKVHDGVPHWMEFIPVDESETDTYLNNPDAHCNKAHVLMYLNSRHWNENKEKRAMLVSSNAGNGTARQKIWQSRKYNRIAFFADCLNGGHVCCKILETQPESLKFFANMIHGGYGVGWIYVVEEYVFRCPILLCCPANN